MKNEDIRTLCPLCKSSYERAGYDVKLVEGQTTIDECDICKRKGFEYKVKLGGVASG